MLGRKNRRRKKRSYYYYYFKLEVRGRERKLDSGKMRKKEGKKKLEISGEFVSWKRQL